MIENLLSPLLTNLTFFATGLGILMIGGMAFLTILLWEWRITLISLVAIQLGVAVLTTEVHRLSTQWGAMQIMVIALAVAMLFLSAQQVRPALRQQRPGSFIIRLSALALLVISWQYIELDLTPPGLTSQETELFLWLLLCAFVMLGLGDSPLYTGVALLLWLIPVQAFIEVILPDQRLFLLIGMAEIFVALACSYLLLAQRIPQRQQDRVLTDITFPEEHYLLPTPTTHPPARQLGDRQLGDRQLGDRQLGDQQPGRRSEQPLLPTTPDGRFQLQERSNGPHATGEHPVATRRPL